MGHLAPGVNSGIRSAGPRQGNSLPGDFLQYGFYGPLNRGGLGLALPALEIGTVIGDEEAESMGRHFDLFSI
jgi:hypothetical protein